MSTVNVNQGVTGGANVHVGNGNAQAALVSQSLADIAQLQVENAQDDIDDAASDTALQTQINQVNQDAVKNGSEEW